MKHEVSIVVTVYNIRKYLRRCLESILVQTCTKFELVLVDDGSADGSERICDEFAAKDRRIKVIHQRNQGLAAARNRGTEAASKEYITYIDGDDYVEPYYLEYLLRALEASGADCVMARFDRVSEKGKQRRKKTAFRWEQWDRRQAFFEILTGKKTGVSSWNKLALREWYLKEPFLEGTVYEDLSNTYRVLFLAKKIAFADAVLYHYAMNAGSITSRKKITPKQCFDFYHAIHLCTEGIIRCYPELKPAAQVLTARDYMALYLIVCRCSQKEAEVLPDERENAAKIFCGSTKVSLPDDEGAAEQKKLTYTEELAEIKKEILAWYKQNGMIAAKNRNAPPSVRLRIKIMSLSPDFYSFLYYRGIRYKGIHLK